MGLKRASLVRKIHAIRELETAPAADSEATAAMLPNEARAEIGRRQDSRSSDIGSQMRARREALGLTTADVSATLRIRENFIAAIEAGQTADLPGMTYAIGYVRSYARFLKLDINATVTQFKNETSDLQTPTQLVFPSPAPEGRVPGGAALLVGLILAVTVYSGWYYMTSKDYLMADLVSEVPERLARLVEPRSNGTAVPSQLSSQAPSPRSATTLPAPVSTPPVTGSQLPVAPAAQSTPAEERQDAKAARGGENLADQAHVAGAVVAQSPARAPIVSGNQQARSVPKPAKKPTPQIVSVPAAKAATSQSDDATPQTEASGASAITSSAAPVTVVVAAAEISGSSDIARNAGQTNVANATTATPQAPDLKNIAISSAQATAPQRDAVPQIGVQKLATGSNIKIRALYPAWIRVRDAAGSVQLSKVLRRGETYNVPTGQIFELSTGDAASLEIYLDENPVQAIGGRGQIVQNFKLDPARLVLTAGD